MGNKIFGLFHYYNYQHKECIKLFVNLISHLTSEKVHPTTDTCDGYLAQQITKLYADTWCKGDYVLHIDSDCVFYKEFSPDCFFIDGKPVLLREKCVDQCI